VKLSRKALFGRVMFALVAAFLGLAAWRLARDLRAHPLRVEPLWLAASALVLGGAFCVLALTFARVLGQAGGQVRPLVRVLELYFRGQLARYLPGKVGIPAVRMAAARDLGLSPGFMAGSVVLEALSGLATATAIGFAIALGPWAAPRFRLPLPEAVAVPLVAGLFFGVAALAIVDLRYYPGFVLRALRLERRSGPLLSRSWLVGAGLSWGLVAAASALCARALSEPWDVAVMAAATGVIAPMVGFLSVFAPGGLGARELFVVLVMQPLIGETRALAFSLVSRALALGMELALWAVSRALLARSEGGSARSIG
jgi:hypothetical protein